MRYAKSSQCPKCKQKWAIRSIGFLGVHEIRSCYFCGWMPKVDRDRLEQAAAKVEVRS